ncbi:conserved hypothetical protein [Candidatus Propionivibrio aalborgensis]|uniref:Glycosyltransferase subfamily 4-like N-terminal domain-containing protein n=1 Tax=Candidatus Propionivibrio aalborgensis TaxID=1860101 RepID=A0A1A8XXH7_9RHOO|nr:hypothetical protein [Candidatus Propionivibrio aalborgensis]SBT09352.1 conserved hypothetical protein [Candidatus Propionivibrio aalborgensis]
MAAKPKVLFLLFEGLAATVVESQVLATVRMLQARRVAEFEVWAFACLAALMQSSRSRLGAAERLAQAPVLLYRAVRPLSPLAYAINVLLFAWRLFPRRRDFTHIHARTDYSAAVAGPVARLFGIELIWDCRGDSTAEVEERIAGRRGWFGLLVQLRVRELRGYTRVAARCCSGALFVTEELHDRYRELVGDKPVEIVPCAAHEELFFFDPKLRAATRGHLGYAAGETVYVYSGSLTEYQGFGDTVAFFAEAYDKDSRSRLLVLTPALVAAQRELARLPQGSFQVHACALGEVNAYLNAADVGFLLRQPLRTNRVAAPTKFAEYGLAGLAVVTSEAVPYAMRIATAVGNLVTVEGGCLRLPSLDRLSVAGRFAASLGRSNFTENYRRIYAPHSDSRSNS